MTKVKYKIYKFCMYFVYQKDTKEMSEENKFQCTYFTKRAGGDKMIHLEVESNFDINKQTKKRCFACKKQLYYSSLSPSRLSYLLTSFAIVILLLQV